MRTLILLCLVGLAVAGPPMRNQWAGTGSGKQHQFSDVGEHPRFDRDTSKQSGKHQFADDVEKKPFDTERPKRDNAEEKKPFDSAKPKPKRNAEEQSGKHQFADEKPKFTENKREQRDVEEHKKSGFDQMKQGQSSFNENKREQRDVEKKGQHFDGAERKPFDTERPKRDNADADEKKPFDTAKPKPKRDTNQSGKQHFADEKPKFTENKREQRDVERKPFDAMKSGQVAHFEENSRPKRETDDKMKGSSFDTAKPKPKRDTNQSGKQHFADEKPKFTENKREQRDTSKQGQTSHFANEKQTQHHFDGMKSSQH